MKPTKAVLAFIWADQPIDLSALQKPRVSRGASAGKGRGRGSPATVVPGASRAVSRALS